MSTKFVFLVLPEIHLLDLAGPDQAIHEAIEYGADFEIEYCSLQNSVISSAGLPLGTVKHFSKIKINRGDYLIIPGSNFSYLISDEFKKNKDLFNWIKLTYDKGANVCSICAGVFVLGECGLLTDQQCTTHFKKTKQLQQMYPKAIVVENILFTSRDGIYTSAGIASGIDLTLHIIEELKGSYFAHKVARELVVYNRRNGPSAQESEMLKFRNHIHSGIHKAQDYIIDRLHQKINLPLLAEMANMSERNFTRVFKKETGVSVNDFLTVIRKEKISELLKNPDFSMIEIASKVGLKSEKQVRRIYNT